ncbi:MAG: hypothetical protein ACRDKS_06090, partial [Actinomycetota bacterium]
MTHLPLEVAANALDLALLEVEGGSADGRSRWTMELDAGHLVLAAPTLRVREGRPSAMSPARWTNGWIRSGVFFFPVELELIAWSATASAIGIRPSGTRPRRLGVDSYH